MSSRSPIVRTEEVLIRAFQAGDEAAFRALNEQWIKHYFEIEAKDEAVFADPQKTIIERGGQILIASAGNQSIGCCALLRMSEDEFEVAKMAVGPDTREGASVAACCRLRLKKHGAYGRADFISKPTTS